jgi:hypothetical protein
MVIGNYLERIGVHETDEAGPPRGETAAAPGDLRAAASPARTKQPAERRHALAVH